MIQSILIHRLHKHRFTYWLKFICNPQINTRGTLATIHRYVRVAKITESPHAQFPASQTRWCSAFSFQLIPWTSPFHYLHRTMIFTFSCFLSVTSLFKWPPSLMPKCYLVSLSTRRLSYEICLVDKLFKHQFLALLGVISVLMNQKHILNKVSLKRNA